MFRVKTKNLVTKLKVYILLAVFTLEDKPIVWTDKHYREFETITICSFVLFFAAFFLSAMLTFQENFPKFIASYDIPIPVQRANYPFARLNVNLGQTLDDLFVWTNKSSSKKGKQTDKLRALNWSENVFVPFSHQTICPSETICPKTAIYCYHCHCCYCCLLLCGTCPPPPIFLKL